MSCSSCAASWACEHEIRERWGDLYEMVRERRYMAGALLNSGAGLARANPQWVVVGFRHVAHCDRMQETANLEALQESVREVFATEQRVQCVVEPDQAAWHAERP